LLVVFAIGAMATYWQRVEIRVLGPLMIGSLLLQAGMGAWAVLDPQTPGVIALHFGISSIAFAAVLLGTTFVTSAEGGEVHRPSPVSASYRRVVWATLAYVLIVIYLGAYVRHAHYEFACGGWPLCNGNVFPGFGGPVGIAFAHRLAALGSVVLLGFLARWSNRIGGARPDLKRGSAIAFGLVLLQSFSGALVVATGLGLWSALSHAGIMALLFGSVCYVCFQSIPMRTEESAASNLLLGRTRDPSPYPSPVGRGD
jgi:cytochrome c oxidase assembly protein subunit 15